MAPEWFMTFEEIVRYNGFECEEHKVTTEDGYILTMHRVYSKEAKEDLANRKVCFLQHGMLDSSTLWIINDPEYAPAFRLAKEGYDVWMGNSRGSTYSREHVKFSNRSSKYWDFSWDKMGEYDAPAQIDYVREHTGQDKVTYVGHSQGST